MKPTAAQEAIDRLYGLPLDEFTGERDELARLIRREGDAELAAEVKQLRKPTLPAWVVDQLARQREPDMQRLLQAGEQLAGAQAEAIRGESGDALLEARREQQHALEALVARASEILADAGRGPAVVDRVLATLRAGSLTADGRALLESGRLTEELEPPGFEALTELDVAAGASRPRPARKAAPPAPEPARSALGELQRRRELAVEARRRIRELRRELHTLDSRAAAIERRAAQLREQLQDAESEASRLGDERRRAEDELDAAERDLEELAADE
jgi:hypothetical protein